MALPYSRWVPGTVLAVWGPSGGASPAVTKNLSCDALAAGSARMGVYLDLGANWARWLWIMLMVEKGTAPTAGGTVDLFMAATHDTSFWPGGVDGTDAAWPADGNEDEWAKQLDAAWVLSLKATNDSNVVGIQQGQLWLPPARYIAPVLDNNMDQAIRDETTASDNGTRIIVQEMFPLQSAA